MNCTNCHSKLRPDQKFCHICGQEAPDQKECAACGIMTSADQKFCHNCGREFDEMRQAASADERENNDKEKALILKIIAFLDDVEDGLKQLAPTRYEEIVNRLTRIIDSYDTSQKNYEAACFAMAKLSYLSEEYSLAMTYLEKPYTFSDTQIARKVSSLKAQINDKLSRPLDVLNYNDTDPWVNTADETQAPFEGEVIPPGSTHVPLSSQKNTLKYVGAGIAGVAFMLFIFALPILILVVLFAGADFLADTVLPFMMSAVWPIIFLSIFIVLPLAIIERTREWGGGMLYLTTLFYGLTAWILGFLATLELWGAFWVVVGLVFLGIGVVPFGILAALFAGEWSILGNLVLMSVLTFGTRMIAVLLLEG